MSTVLESWVFSKRAESVIDLIDYVIDLLEECNDRDCIDDAISFLNDAKEIIEKLEKSYRKIIEWWDECEAELESMQEELEAMEEEEEESWDEE